MPPERISCRIVYPIEKIRPVAEELPDGPQSPILIAGGEREPFLFVVENVTGWPAAVTGISLIIQRPGVTAAVYRVEYVNIKRPTPPFSGAGRKGRWPDPLIPLDGGDSGAGVVQAGVTNIGGYCADISLAEPVTVPPGENRCFLVDLYRPAGRGNGGGAGACEVEAAAPAPQGAITVTARLGTGAVAGGAEKPVALTAHAVIELYPVTLPACQRLVTAFGFNWSEVQYKHRQLSEVAFGSSALHRDYLRQLAINRIAPFVPWHEPPAAYLDENGAVTVDWSGFDEVAGRLLDGELFEDVPPATSFVFPFPARDVQGAEREAFYAEAVRHLAENGWMEKAFYYLPDEPLRRQYDEVRARAEGFATLAPGVRRLVTEPFVRSLADVVEIWCSDVIALGDTFPFFPMYLRRDGFHLDWQRNVRPGMYAERQELGEEVWYYTSTASRIGPYPNLFIDYPAAYARIIPWIAYLYGLDGVLHWETSYDYRGSENPWTGFYNFHANGDGNLLYPGLPGSFGFEKHQALPSMRLILFREGVDDYEYLSLVAEAAGRDEAMSLAQSMAKTSVRWCDDVQAFYDVKRAMMRLLSE